MAIDFYNQCVTGEVAKTLTGMRIDVSNLPCVMYINSSGGEIAGTLDSSYYKGQGERQGIEREYIVEMSRHDSRPSDSEDVSTGRSCVHNE